MVINEVSGIGDGIFSQTFRGKKCCGGDSTNRMMQALKGIGALGDATEVAACNAAFPNNALLNPNPCNSLLGGSSASTTATTGPAATAAITAGLTNNTSLNVDGLSLSVPDNITSWLNSDSISGLAPNWIVAVIALGGLYFFARK